MKKRLIASLFIALFLCAPTFAGHVLAGGYCAPCDVPGCICDPGEEQQNRRSQQAPTDLGTEALFILAALMLVLRITKA